MEQKSQDFIPLLEAIVRETKSRGWNQRALSKNSGVAAPVISLDFETNTAYLTISNPFTGYLSFNRPVKEK